MALLCATALKCKAFIPLSQAQQYAYPVEWDLVVVDFQEPYLQMETEIFQYRFVVVLLSSFLLSTRCATQDNVKYIALWKRWASQSESSIGVHIPRNEILSHKQHFKD